MLLRIVRQQCSAWSNVSHALGWILRALYAVSGPGCMGSYALCAKVLVVRRFKGGEVHSANLSQVTQRRRAPRISKWLRSCFICTFRNGDIPYDRALADSLVHLATRC